MQLVRLIYIVFFITFTAHSSDIITIATGSTSGLYYPSGGAICRIFNLSSNGETKCIVESTPGSEYNLNAVEGGLNNFAFVQADEFFSYLQMKQKDGKESGVQIVFPLYTETFVMIASKDSGINTIEDIKGKRINIGVDGSGVRNFTSSIIKHLGTKSTDFKSIFTENQSSIEHFICNNIIDASLVVSGQPNSMIKNLIENCGAKIITFSQDFIKSIMQQNSFYTVSEIPGGMYFGYNQNIQTVGTKALLITSKYTNDEQIYNMVGYIIQNFGSFKQYSPVTERMTVEALNATLPHFPVHPSVIKAFRENGIN
jgi:TRAP transporter TAXI family solute receptor